MVHSGRLLVESDEKLFFLFSLPLMKTLNESKNESNIITWLAIAKEAQRQQEKKGKKCKI